MFDDAFLRLIRCPITRSPLQFAPAELIERINVAIERGDVLNRLGEKVQDALEAGLINGERSLLYPVRHEIPTLIGDEALDVTGFSPAGTGAAPDID